MATSRTAVVVGNPRPASRTLAAARYVATELGGHDPDLVVDLAVLGADLLDHASAEVSGLVEQVRGSDLVVFACPTYKGSFTGLLKLFLDRFGAGALGGAVGVPLMLGGGPRHALAPEAFLRPVLVEIGATVPVPALYVLDAEHDRPEAYADWLDAARGPVGALLDARVSA